MHEWVEEALARRVQPGVDPSTEVAMLDALPADKRGIVCTRLKVIDDYLEAPTRGTEGAAKAAEMLGLSLRSFYRLVERLAERGPVAALAPNFGRRKRSDAVEELPPEVEAVLRRNPAARWNVVLREVREVVAGSGIEVSPSAIRRRLMSLRAQAVAPGEDVVFGKALLLDRIAADIVYATADGEPRYVVADVLVDESTGYVMGASMVDDDDADSLRRVLVDATSRVRLLAPYTLNCARSPERIRWSVPDGLVEMSSAVSRSARGVSPLIEIEIEATVSGRFRFGSDLVRIIGDTVGQVKLLVRAAVDPAADGHTGGLLDRAQAYSLLRVAVDDHNRARTSMFVRRRFGVRRFTELNRLVLAILTAFSALSGRQPFVIGRPDEREMSDLRASGE